MADWQNFYQENLISTGNLVFFCPILANNLKENSVRLTESINFSQEILISCFALPGSRKKYSALLIEVRKMISTNYIQELLHDCLRDN